MVEALVDRLVGPGGQGQSKRTAAKNCIPSDGENLYGGNLYAGTAQAVSGASSGSSCYWRVRIFQEMCQEVNEELQRAFDAGIPSSKRTSDFRTCLKCSGNFIGSVSSNIISSFVWTFYSSSFFFGLRCARCNNCGSHGVMLY